MCFARKTTRSSFPWLCRSDTINQADTSSGSSGQRSRQPRHSNKLRTLPPPPTPTSSPPPSLPFARWLCVNRAIKTLMLFLLLLLLLLPLSSLQIKFPPLSFCPPFPGGHENFRKMIDEAEPLGYPVVVKNARGHRGKTLVTAQQEELHSATSPRPRRPFTAAQPTLP